MCTRQRLSIVVHLISLKCTFHDWSVWRLVRSQLHPNPSHDVKGPTPSFSQSKVRQIETSPVATSLRSFVVLFGILFPPRLHTALTLPTRSFQPMFQGFPGPASFFSDDSEFEISDEQDNSDRGSFTHVRVAYACSPALVQCVETMIGGLVRWRWHEREPCLG